MLAVFGLASRSPLDRRRPQPLLRLRTLRARSRSRRERGRRLERGELTPRTGVGAPPATSGCSPAVTTSCTRCAPTSPCSTPPPRPTRRRRSSPRSAAPIAPAAVARALVDAFGHNPYPRTSAEEPWTTHAPGFLGEGDYARLVATLQDAFGGTGQRSLDVWYLEDGYQPRHRPGSPATTRDGRTRSRSRPRRRRCDSARRSVSPPASRTFARSSTSSWSTRRASPAGNRVWSGAVVRKSRRRRRSARRRRRSGRAMPTAARCWNSPRRVRRLRRHVRDLRDRLDRRPARPGNRLAAMSATLVHRGPDSGGEHRDGPVALAARRLSIIDLAHGDQPIANEDGSCVGRPERRDLQLRASCARARARRAPSSATHCDTEAIVHAYEEQGLGFAERLRGMFAVAVWDARRRRLVLARDRFGIKPLYYRRRRRRAARSPPSCARCRAARSTSTRSRRSSPSTRSRRRYSIFREIRKLPAGHVLAWEEAARCARALRAPGPAARRRCATPTRPSWSRSCGRGSRDSVRAHLARRRPGRRAALGRRRLGGARGARRAGDLGAGAHVLDRLRGA